MGSGKPPIAPRIGGLTRLGRKAKAYSGWNDELGVHWLRRTGAPLRGASPAGEATKQSASLYGRLAPRAS